MGKNLIISQIHSKKKALKFSTFFFKALFLLSTLSNIFVYASNVGQHDYKIVVKKGNNSLTIEQNGQIIKTYHIATGRGGTGDKVKRGDKKTPTGKYKVTGFNESSKFDFFFQINYPNVKDAYYGFKRSLITKKEFDKIISAIRENRHPPQNTLLGGAIGIHGIGIETRKKIIIHENINWTEGCIALRNFEARDLKKFVKLGTIVNIQE